MGKLALVIVVAAIAVTCSSSSWSQGTKDNQSGQPQSGASRTSGSKSDTMGGAFKGTGTPNFGTSPGMGAEKKTKR
ncbi:hypothetical protein [Bradyrhizobium sp. LTSP885]|uniref:hypothetical protein n=1 Tax=Bradyrhizobium sp. LTSP885 TaxID=1619232 RepID=UPI000B32C3EE|nr:hypothetical protein [Bradyrhizobium sp. LTSP885]